MVTQSPYKDWTVEQIKQLKKNQIPEGKTYSQCSYFCRVHLHCGFQPVKLQLAKDRDLRGKKFHEMHEKGMSYRDIAKAEGVTRQRVHAIIKQWLDSIKLDG